MYLINKTTTLLSLALAISPIVFAMEQDRDLAQAIKVSLQAESNTLEQALYQIALQESQEEANKKAKSSAPNTTNDETLAEILQMEEINADQHTLNNGKQEKKQKPQKVQTRQNNPGKQEVSTKETQKTTKQKTTTTKTNQQSKCNICLDQKSDKEFSKLNCNHSFCTACLKVQVHVALSEKNTQKLFCPTCRKQMTENDIRTIESDKLPEYSEVATREAIRLQQNMKPCPTPDCTMVYEVEQNATRYFINCHACNKTFCTECLLQHTKVVSCADARLTSNKDEAEKASNQLINSSTKPCPKCKTKIEKNDGCLHMTCRECKHEFCWKCLQKWNGHIGFFSCPKNEVNPVQHHTSSHQANPRPLVNPLGNNRNNLFQVNPEQIVFLIEAPNEIQPHNNTCKYIVRFTRNLNPNIVTNVKTYLRQFMGGNLIEMSDHYGQPTITTFLSIPQMRDFLRQVNEALALRLTSR